MLYKIYAGVNGKMDYCGTRKFYTQQDAIQFALEVAIQSCRNKQGRLQEADTLHLTYSVEEVEDD